MPGMLDPYATGGLTRMIQQMQGKLTPNMGPDNSLEKILLGLTDSRGPMGQAARGTNIYRGATGAPNTGSSFGDLSKSAIQRRLMASRAQAGGKPVVSGMPQQSGGY